MDWISSAVEAGGNFLSGIFGGLFNANQAKKNRAFQERMYNQQVQDNINFWKMNNEYNDPSAQLERLRNAGINPNLYYSGGNIQNVASSAPDSASAPSGAQGSMSMGSPFSGFTSGIAQMKMLDQNIKESRSREFLNYVNAQKSRSETAETEKRIENLTFDLAFKQDTRDLEITLKTAQYDLSKSMENMNRQQASLLQKECFKIEAEVNRINALIRNEKELNDAQVKDINTRLDKFLEEFPHIIANLDSQTRLNFANAYAADVAATVQKNLYTSDYIKILQGQEGQNLLNAMKYGTAQDIQNGILGLEFLSRPQAGSKFYKFRNLMDFVVNPSATLLKDAAITAGSIYLTKGAIKGPVKVTGFH